MSRESDLLRSAAEALDDGRNPLTNPFLSDHDVELDECFDLASNLAAGAEIVAWMMDNPAKARVALRGAIDELRMRMLADALKRATV